ncbi:MAG: single-stranded-DNA-specific exonuclease RecJ [Pseudomonadota bacterium]
MRWLTATPRPDIVETLERALDIPRVLAHLLAVRGLETPEEARSFLYPTLGTFPDPSTMPQINEASARLAKAIRGKESILIWGDYDVDGITSTVLLLSFIDDCGGTAAYYLPHREDDGYGMNMPRAEQTVADGVDLVITVDCGTANHAVLGTLADAGVDVIVTDHHVLQGEHPRALAFINPQRLDAPAAFRPLAGVGVAFLLVAGTRKAMALGDSVPPLKSYLDMVALGTIADMVPLTGLNRTLVHHGLHGWEKPARPGLSALKRIAGIEDRILDSGTIAFAVGPRLNAAGRLDTASLSVELLRTRSFAEGLIQAKELDRLNSERKEIEAEIFQQAVAQVGRTPEEVGPQSIVVVGEGWTRGVLGIVASRLVQTFHRPAVVLSVDASGTASGSGRSIKPFNLVRALEASADLMDRYGGHAMAAGMTLPLERVAALRERLSAAVAAEVSAEDLIPSLDVDMEIAIDAVDQALVTAVETLAPFGNGNPEPRFLSRSVPLLSCKRVGKDGAHLKLVVDGGGGRRVEAIAFRRGDAAVEPGAHVDLVYVPEFKTWRGIRSLQLRVEDLGRSAQ